MSPFRMNKIEESPRTVIKFFESINNKNIDDIQTIIDPACVVDDFHEIESKKTNKDSLIACLNEIFRNVWDLKLSIHETISAGHRCVVTFTLFEKIENITREYRCAGIFEVHNGKITSINIYSKIPEPSGSGRPTVMCCH